MTEEIINIKVDGPLKNGFDQRITQRVDEIIRGSIVDDGRITHCVDKHIQDSIADKGRPIAIAIRQVNLPAIARFNQLEAKQRELTSKMDYFEQLEAKQRELASKMDDTQQNVGDLQLRVEEFADLAKLMSPTITPVPDATTPGTRTGPTAASPLANNPPSRFPNVNLPSTANSPTATNPCRN